VDPDSTDPEADLRVLTQAERERAAGMSSNRARRMFVCVRAALRRALADEVGCDVSEVVLSRDAFGRPVLARPAVAMHVSVSHTSGIGLIATSRTLELGVDVERADRPVPPPVADLVLLPNERETLDATGRDDRARAALRMWVRKEALAKADGRGLHLIASGIDVTGPRVRIDGPDGAARVYRIDDLDLGPSHLAAIAWTPARRAAVRQSRPTSRSESRLVGAASP
jgi:4'-phosphopantetheinyl transferase